MKKLYSLVLIIFLLIACTSIDKVSSGQFVEAPLLGMIYDSKSSPVTGAVVVLDDGESSKTDINGRVFLSAVSQGEHFIVISKEGFEETRMVLNFSSRDQVLFSTLISLQDILDQFESSLESGETTTAKSFLDRAAEIDLDDIRFKYLKIVYLTKINEYKEALREVNFLMELYPDDPSLILTQSNITENMAGATNEKN